MLANPCNALLPLKRAQHTFQYAAVKDIAFVAEVAVYHRFTLRDQGQKILTIEQIKDLVAYVMSPESPVNK